MQITPEWVGVVLTAMAMSGAAATWFERKRAEARQAMPIVRAAWNPEHPFVTITVVNRLNEDLFIDRAEAKADFIETRHAPGEGWEYTPPKVVRVPSPLRLDWHVRAGETATFDLGLSNRNAQRWIRLTMSSSSRTLRRKRLSVADNQKP
ncbi:hypothetical protein [Croceibacterium aestuarii]|uniref:hypothetical protein n=1 Tax=Croceibacterium aestuarii TaxID=3064139 RepID=UPI00272E7FA0|nr:hypothetical protein [Croceibacterium sp. D39]